MIHDEKKHDSSKGTRKKKDERSQNLFSLDTGGGGVTRTKVEKMKLVTFFPLFLI